MWAGGAHWSVQTAHFVWAVAEQVRPVFLFRQSNGLDGPLKIKWEFQAKKGGEMMKRGPHPTQHTHTPFAFYLVVRVVTIYDSCLKAEETNGQLVNYLTRKKSLANLFVCTFGSTPKGVNSITGP